MNAVRDIFCRGEALGVADGVGHDLAAGIGDSGDGAVQVVRMRECLCNAQDGALFGGGSAGRVVRPGSCAAAVTHGGHAALGIGIA